MCGHQAEVAHGLDVGDDGQRLTEPVRVQWGPERNAEGDLALGLDVSDIREHLDEEGAGRSCQHDGVRVMQAVDKRA